ncbi:glycosyltransferase [Azospirillum halopraeferens]|uniref:glycosyltransferase n=1 Tax=Azospirillum halopraeferens TaxID=34010 RepID=UPI000421320A|nr:glycosyltransferase [Azospirillum halopraeferens]
MPLTTVIIPCFNAAPTLADAVASALAQRVGAVAVEVLVVDDASTDGSAAVAERLAATDPAVRLLRRPGNGGAAAARNAGLAAARGAYVAFLDADDRHAPGWLAAATGLLEANPALAAVSCAIEPVGCARPVHPLQVRAAEESAPGNVVVRRTVAAAIGGFPESPRFRTRLGGEDIAWRSALHTWFGPVLRISGAYLQYRVTPGNHFDRFLDRSRVVSGRLRVDRPSHEEADRDTLRAGLAAYARDLAARLPVADTDTIPRLIHQMAPGRESWRHHNPGWEHRLWRPEDLRAFVAAREPWFLPILDGYGRPECRVAAARHIVLRHCGGVFAGSGPECRGPLAPVLAGHTAVAGVIPATPGGPPLPDPSFLAAAPGHRFWNTVLTRLAAARADPDPSRATGAALLAGAWQAHRNGPAAPHAVPLERVVTP